MRLLLKLEDHGALEDCVCAVIHVDECILSEWRGLCQTLMVAHVLEEHVYKIDFWGSTLYVHSEDLLEALFDFDQELEKRYDTDGYLFLPETFCYSHQDLLDRFQKLECRMTEIVQPQEWYLDNIEMQFSAVVKHTTTTLRTKSLSYGLISQLYDEALGDDDDS
jgi:hypothetical protein